MKKSLNDYVVNTFSHNCDKLGFTDKNKPLRLGAWNYIKLVKKPAGVDVYFSNQQAFNGARILNDSNRGEKILSENEDGEYKTYANLFIWIVNKGFSNIQGNDSNVVIEYSGENVKIEPLLGNTFEVSKIDNISGIERQAGVNYVYPMNNQITINELLTYRQALTGALNAQIDAKMKEVLALSKEIDRLNKDNYFSITESIRFQFIRGDLYNLEVALTAKFKINMNLGNIYDVEYSQEGVIELLELAEYTNALPKPKAANLAKNGLFSLCNNGNYTAEYTSGTNLKLSIISNNILWNKYFGANRGKAKDNGIKDFNITIKNNVVSTWGKVPTKVDASNSVFFSETKRINEYIGYNVYCGFQVIPTIKNDTSALQTQLIQAKKDLLALNNQVESKGYMSLMQKTSSNNIAFSCKTLLNSTIKKDNTTPQSNINFILVNFINKTTQNLTIKASAIISNAMRMNEANAHIIKIESVNNATAQTLKEMINALNTSDTITEENIPKGIIFSNYQKIGKLEYDSETLLESIVQSGESQVVSGDTIITIPAYSNMWLFVSDYLFASPNANEHKCAVVADSRIDIKIIGVENASI